MNAFKLLNVEVRKLLPKFFLRNTATRNGDNGGEGSMYWIGFRHARTTHIEVSSFVGI